MAGLRRGHLENSSVGATTFPQDSALQLRKIQKGRGAEIASSSTSSSMRTQSLLLLGARHVLRLCDSPPACRKSRRAVFATSSFAAARSPAVALKEKKEAELEGRLEALPSGKFRVQLDDTEQSSSPKSRARLQECAARLSC